MIIHKKLKNVNILITNSQAPTCPGTVYSLRQEFKGNIISVSHKKDAIGHFLANKSHTYSKEDSKKYLKKIISICNNEEISIIIPLSISERILFLENIESFNKINVKILSSSIESIKQTEDKTKLFEICKNNGISVPEHYVVDNYIDLKEKSILLGYPKNKVVVKPINSSGSCGLRILNKKANYKKLFYNTRADYTEITLADLKEIIGKKFTPLIISEFLPGVEYTVDCLRYNKQNYAFPRIRTEIKHGLTYKGQMYKNPELIRLSKKIAQLFDLTTVFGFQFKLNSNLEPVIIDCNPRIQGTMIMGTLANANIIAAGVKMLLGEEIIKFKPDWKLKYYRFWSGVSKGNDKKIINF